MRSTVIVHYHEIGLKGRNRGFFEKVLMDNLQDALADVPHDPPSRLRGRIEVPLQEGACQELAQERVSRVFGVADFAIAQKIPADLPTIQETAWRLMREETFQSFRVRSRRADKSFSLRSMEIDAEVGDYILQQRPARVDLTHPDITCFAEVVGDKCFVHVRKLPGPGGLPVGADDRILCLLSGGIDSPVAAYRLMRRGAPVSFVHFHGAPFTDRSSQEVARELVQHLSRFQFRSKLYLVPFGEIQREVSLKCEAAYRILLYRRLMVRIAEVIAGQEKALALGTGDNLGQVASQTLANLRSIDAAATLPILRPLIGDDKMEIVEAAKAIGTYATSTTPHVEDCCPLFMPAQPITHARLENVLQVEANLEVDDLARKGIEAMKVERFIAPWLKKR